MTDRFSNFDDDDDVSGFGTSSIASSSLESNGTHGKKINGERKPNVKASESSFDDFDSEWDSEAPSAPGPSNRPGRSPSIPSNVSSSVSKPHNSGARSPLGGGGDFGDFESPKALDRDRIRSSNLDDGSDSHFGSSRTGSRGETDKKVSTGLQLRDFSLTPSNEDSHRSRPNGPLRDDDSERKGSKYDEQMPPMPQVQYEPFSVEPPSHYQNYLYLLKYIHGLKILCGIHMVRGPYEGIILASNLTSISTIDSDLILPLAALCYPGHHFPHLVLDRRNNSSAIWLLCSPPSQPKNDSCRTPLNGTPLCHYLSHTFP